MEIAKYIGQFLLKNNYCYIHGLGNLELRKLPAVHDGKTLLPPSYEVVVTSGGSIDDSFANFIATNEQISISKAANALRDFSMQSRTQLAAGQDVVIEGMGKFIETRGKITFVTHPEFKYAPAGMPTLKNSKQLEEQKVAATRTPAFPPTPKAKSGTINWTTIIVVGILILLLGGGGFGFYYYQSLQKEPAPVLVKDTIINTEPPIITDSLAPAVDSLNAAPVVEPVDTNAVSTMKIVIGYYTNKSAADKRYRQLKIGGNPSLEMITKDSINYSILMSVNCRLLDTTHVKDSLRVFYGYKDVVIYNK